MKKLFSLLMVILFSFVSLMAQTIVGTDPENKNVVLEEFTGIHCVYCPDGHAIAQGIYDAHPDDVVLINIHQGPFADPNAGEPDFRTQWGNAIAGQSDLIGYPAGTVNRHFFPGHSQGGGTAQSRGSWNTTSNITMGEPSYLNIELEATIVTSTRQLVVYVEVYYTGDSPEETNFLNVAILQNNILGPQVGGGAGNNYNHKHMLRHFLTGQWGVEIDETTTGSLFSETFTYELPDDYNGVDVVLEDLDIVGYVSETHQEVVSGNMAEITLVESNEYDAALFTTYVPQTACSGALNAEVMLKNYGTAELTSLNFIYSVNGGETAEYAWTGALSQYETELVSLPEYLYDATDKNEISIECQMPNGQADQLPRNDVYLKNSPGSQTYPSDCYFGIETPENPEDLTWSIVGDNGEVVAEGGPYASGGFKVSALTFPESGCYTLTVNDASGSGLDGGIYVMLDVSSNVLWTGKPFTDKAITELAHDITIEVPEFSEIENISVYPNPVTQYAVIDFRLNSESMVNIALFDMLGRSVLPLFEGKMNSGQQKIRMNVSGLNEGIYFVRFRLNNEVFTQKISLR
ncbi:MAG: T9SS type A sorting domain-containing protein [Bacteroidales bacterium]|nr:T9SS type A sorting domain-containing protein [Bacteroidales bacterium]MCF6341222.1 T9SS type A sorting domain-containing protein [Bacteroidales bacterium]